MDNQCSVKDLYLAAYLFNEGQKLVDVNRQNNICWFVFDNKIKCDELMRGYWQNEASSKIKSYVESLRTLKDIIYSPG